MKKRIKRYAGMGLLCLFLFGCTKEQIQVDAYGNIEGAEVKAVSMEESAETLSQTGEEANKNSQYPEEAEQDSEGKQQPQENVSMQEEDIWVHICGQVNYPGVYELPQGSRIWDALQAAGGVTDGAYADYLNQAGRLEDGMKIIVPTKAEAEMWAGKGVSGIEEDPFAGVESREKETETDHRIDLNTADEAALCTLPGIGASRAKSIIAYREENGPFMQIEDVMKVSGIKEAAFAKIKEYIRVS
ncbi:MAG: helix-hairpin-helix domain-containing protein [Lachnospiraceae bacterium]|nr:helix-hairpin-helix domain-containing protein [Lachnospiraceae bacterium]